MAVPARRLRRPPSRRALLSRNVHRERPAEDVSQRGKSRLQHPVYDLMHCQTPRKTNASSHRKDHTEKHGLKFHKLKQGHPTALEQRETECKPTSSKLSQQYTDCLDQYRKLYKAARGWPVNSNGSPSRNALSHKSLKSKCHKVFQGCTNNALQDMAPKLSRNLKGKLGAVPKNSRRDPSGPAIRTVLGVKATKCDYCQWADRGKYIVKATSPEILTAAECCKSWADHDTCMYLGQFTWM